MRTCGTIIRGIRAPILKKGDDLATICTESLFAAVENENFSIENQDILGITEAVLARTQGNYASVEDIATDINKKFRGDKIGLVFPIMSRNRFSLILKGIALTNKKIIVQFSYPSDEVGNPIISAEKLNSTKINPWEDVFTSREFIETFGDHRHPFTGINYIELYESIGNTEVIMANNPTEILNHADEILVCDIHTRETTKKMIRDAGAKTVFALDEILNCDTNGSGYNPQYGLLGSNIASETQLKLFPRDADIFVKKVQSLIKEKTGKLIEVLIYGDGGFKDPVGLIWELADPIISPGFTDGLSGLPKEVKIKYLADNKFANLSGNALSAAIKKHLASENEDESEKEGTTPRRIVDLVGSLCDLASGSGSKGTPFVYIKGYFDHMGVE